MSMRKVALITDGWRRLFTYAWQSAEASVPAVHEYRNRGDGSEQRTNLRGLCQGSGQPDVRRKSTEESRKKIKRLFTTDNSYGILEKYD